MSLCPLFRSGPLCWNSPCTCPAIGLDVFYLPFSTCNKIKSLFLLIRDFQYRFCIKSLPPSQLSSSLVLQWKWGLLVFHFPLLTVSAPAAVASLAPDERSLFLFWKVLFYLLFTFICFFFLSSACSSLFLSPIIWKFAKEWVSVSKTLFSFFQVSVIMC